MIAARYLQEAVARLKNAGVNEPGKDARLLMAFAWGLAPDRLLLHLQEPFPLDAQARFDRAIAARMRHQPLSQIIGGRLFWGRWFKVTPDVLDPRPETETLVQLALQQPFEHVLDLGVGSGAILLTLLAECAGAKGVGADISPAALQVATDNAQMLGVNARARLICSDWFSDIQGAFDLVVANPPYIAADEMAGLSPDVRLWEPEIALTPGGDGLSPYRRIVANIHSYLLPKGRLMVEIGHRQGADVADIFAQAGLCDVQLHHDMNGKDRVISARKA